MLGNPIRVMASKKLCFHCNSWPPRHDAALYTFEGHFPKNVKKTTRFSPCTNRFMCTIGPRLTDTTTQYLQLQSMPGRERLWSSLTLAIALLPRCTRDNLLSSFDPHLGTSAREVNSCTLIGDLTSIRRGDLPGPGAERCTAKATTRAIASMEHAPSGAPDTEENSPSASVGLESYFRT